MIDTLHYSGRVHEAIRNHQTAIDSYARAIAFTMREDQYPYVDEDVRLDLRESIDPSALAKN